MQTADVNLDTAADSVVINCKEMAGQPIASTVQLGRRRSGVTTPWGLGDEPSRTGGEPHRWERRSGCSAAPQRSDRVEQILDPQTELGIAFERQFALEEQPVRVVTTAHQTP